MPLFHFSCFSAAAIMHVDAPLLRCLRRFAAAAMPLFYCRVREFYARRMFSRAAKSATPARIMQDVAQSYAPVTP